ncbi:roadblock/LC7 domain-containing protein, partial [Myxococcota bacterium]|nr:roadblock/LC7 domain-containing protein [Myxococcota bacterium]
MKLTRFESQEIKETMDQLVIDSGAMSALLITKEGFNLQEAGNTGFLNTTALAALIAGMFTATKEVARMVGEAQFSILLQQGENRHIHISLIDESNMMVIIFEDYQKIGRVR